MKYAVTGFIGFVMILAAFYFMTEAAENLILVIFFLVPGAIICSCAIAGAIEPDDLP